MSLIDTLLFDLDGTLVDSVDDLATSINLLRSESSLPPLDHPTIKSYVGDGASLLVKRSLPAELHRDTHLDRFLAIYADHLAEETRPYPGIIQLLEGCRDKTMAVVTNKPVTLALNLLEQLALLGFFKVVVGGDSTQNKKPDPEPVRLALAKLGKNPAGAVMIGDHINDLLAGRAAGTLTCFCAWGFGGHADVPSDMEAATPAELHQLLLHKA